MGRITIDLNDETERKIQASAKASNLTVSKWIARLIEEKTAEQWSASVRELAGAWPDFPQLEEIRDTAGGDVPREPF